MPCSWGRSDSYISTAANDGKIDFKFLFGVKFKAIEDVFSDFEKCFTF